MNLWDHEVPVDTDSNYEEDDDVFEDYVHNATELDLEEPEVKSDEDGEVHNAAESEEESDGDWDAIPSPFEILPGYGELFNFNPFATESSADLPETVFLLMKDEAVLVEQALALESEVLTLRELISHPDFNRDVAIRIPALLFFPGQIVKDAFYYYGNFDLESVITDIDEELNFLVVAVDLRMDNMIDYFLCWIVHYVARYDMNLRDTFTFLNVKIIRQIEKVKIIQQRDLDLKITKEQKMIIEEEQKIMQALFNVCIKLFFFFVLICVLALNE